MADKLTALMVGSGLDTRMRLLHATNSVTEFGKCEVASSLNDAPAKIGSAPQPLNIIFLSYEFPEDDSVEFARSVRTYDHARDCAIINLLPANSLVDDSIAKNMLAGTDGFLIEPYSCEDLLEIANLSTRVTRDRISAREIVAARFLVKDIIRLLDAMYCLNRCQVDIAQTQKKFREACERVPEMGEVAQKVYMQLLIEGFERSLEPIDVTRNAYKGKSERAKKRVENMLVNKYEESHREEVVDKKKGVMMNGKFLRLPPMGAGRK